MFLLKSVVVLAQWSWAAGLEAGDCAFVGAYADKDDFALVLLENAGEQIYITDESQSGNWHPHSVSKWVAAKEHVKDAKRGTVLRKSDFQTQETSLIAPVALTAFKGSPESPEILCSIRMSGKGPSPGVPSEDNLVELDSDVAEYMGSTAGTKDELVESIVDTKNWRKGPSARKLKGFSVASGHGNHSETMSTTMNPPPPPPRNGTSMTMTTTMDDDATTTMDDATTTTMEGGSQPPPPTTVPKTDSGNAAAMTITGALMLLVRMLL